MLAAIIAIGLGACALCFFLGGIIGAGSRADLDQQISALRWHLVAIICEIEDCGAVSQKTIEKARKILNEQE